MSVRLIVPQQLILLRPDIWIPHDGLGWRMAPRLDTRVNTGEREVRLATDADGYRTRPEPTDRDGPPSRHVLALGDSFLAAIQVDFPDTLTAILERRLEAARVAVPDEGAWRIVNAGVGGYDPNHYLLVARDELAREDRQYQVVLVFLFLGNDVVARRVDHFPPKKSSVRHRFRWPASLSRNEWIDAFLYPLNDSLETRSHFFMLARNRAWHVLMRLGLSARRFPSAELVASARDPRFAVTGEICAVIAAEAAERGAPSLFVLLPGIYHVDPAIGRRYATGVGLAPGEYDFEQSARLLGAELAGRGLDHLDTTPALRRAHSAGAETHGRVDTHLAPRGHLVVAEELLPRVRALLTGGGSG